MAAIDITGAGGDGISNVTGTSPVVVTIVGTARNVSLDQTQFKTINGNSIFGAGNIVISTGLTNWTEAFNSGTQATSSFTATNAATNVNAALVPKGTGAIVAQIPDGTTAGGNARGSYAVDFQMQRTNSNQVALGANSGILSGRYNRVDADRSVVGGGAVNIITSTSGASIICGGFTNTISDQGLSFIGGGDNQTISGSGRSHFIGGGGTNSVSGSGIGSFIGGGTGHTISSNYGTIVGGEGINVSGTNAFSGGGKNNLSSGSYSAILGGEFQTASAQYSAILGGLRANAYLYGQKAHANGRFTIDGDAQGSEAILRLNDGFTDAQTKEIYLDGSSLRITGPTNSAMTVNIDIVAIVTAITGTATGVTVGDMFSQNEICAYKNIGGTGTNVGSYSIHKIHDASMAACDTAFATTGAALQVFFTGPNFAGGGTVTLRIVAKARIVETRY